MIFLFTDFGGTDIYAGQVRAVLAGAAPGEAVIDLTHDAPALNVKASAHLLAALALRLPAGAVTLAVVDPGVGSAREAVAVEADGRWYVGPDNGLLSVVAARAGKRECWRITWRPRQLSASFHGRDLFAPVAADIARGEFPAAKAAQLARLDIDFGAGDLAEIIHIDHYGNALTGLRAADLPRTTPIVAAGRWIGHARVFSDVAPGELFWYEDSLGLVEIAGNACSASARLGLAVGHPFAVGT